MTTPSTEAGRRILEQWMTSDSDWLQPDEMEALTDDILAIEAEAAAAARADADRLAEALTVALSVVHWRHEYDPCDRDVCRDGRAALAAHEATKEVKDA